MKEFIFFTLLADVMFCTITGIICFLIFLRSYGKYYPFQHDDLWWDGRFEGFNKFNVFHLILFIYFIGNVIYKVLRISYGG